jgi:hypothetical protein
MSKRDDGFTASQILRQLDRSAREFEFPMLDNAYVRLADVRLTAFRSPTEWLIVFEEIALFQERTFANTVSAYGNKLARPGTQLGIDDLITSVPGHPIWDDEGNFRLNLWAFTIAINGQTRRFSPSREDYARAGVDVDADDPNAAKILRLLTVLVPDELFLSDARLLEVCGRADSSLKRFLQMDDWHHPDVADEELPRESDCLRSLAEALAKDDKDAYACPEELFNTHWSNWVVKEK